MTALVIRRIGPGAGLQDGGRPGQRSQGISAGGAADPLALAEGQALLGQARDAAALEIPQTGGAFTSDGPLRIALTGAPSPARIDGRPVAWSASHWLPAGASLEIGAPSEGRYAYLHAGGGIATEPQMSSRALHGAAGLGAPLAPGDRLPVAGPQDGACDRLLDPADRWGGGTVHLLRGPQSGLFPEALLARMAEIPFAVTARANRQGVRLDPGGALREPGAGLSVVSEAVVPGDVQIAGDGAPFVLGPECQTTGGYPRIGTVLPQDLGRVMQARTGEVLRFAWVTLDDGLALWRMARTRAESLPARAVRRVRSPDEMSDLLRYELIDGVTTGRDDAL